MIIARAPTVATISYSTWTSFVDGDTENDLVHPCPERPRCYYLYFPVFVFFFGLEP